MRGFSGTPPLSRTPWWSAFSRSGTVITIGAAPSVCVCAYTCVHTSTRFGRAVLGSEERRRAGPGGMGTRLNERDRVRNLRVARAAAPPPSSWFSRLLVFETLPWFYRGVVPKPQVVLAPAAWGGAAMRRPSLHGAGEFVSATWEMINGNFFECAPAASVEPPSCIAFARACTCSQHSFSPPAQVRLVSGWH